MVGTWKIADMEACNLPQQVATGFSQVFENIVGASYLPVLYCGEQIVHGTNHMIICKQTLVTNPPQEHIVKVVLNQPLPDQGDWIIVSIENII